MAFVSRQALNKYNESLFDLYLAYLRRYRLQYFHIGQAKALATLFEKNIFPALREWEQIYYYHRQYPLPNNKSKFCGSAFLKIGCMLEELGILLPRQENLSVQIASLLGFFAANELELISKFIENLRQKKASESTVCDYLRVLRDFKLWLNSAGQIDWLSVSSEAIESYLEFMFTKKFALSYVRKTRANLSRFFAWCRLSRIILVNPCQGINVCRESLSLTVCSEEQIKKLYSFIKAPASNSEGAFLLALILFFGLSTEDLTFAKLDLHRDQLAIKLRRKPLTKGKRRYNRKEFLLLPTKPRWFFDLQKRFYQDWLNHYKIVKKTYPNHQLALPYNNHFNHAISSYSVRDRIKVAVIAATGAAISPRVLRQTCGHIYSRNQDASLLSTMGWSSSFAFDYTWLPRKYFS